ncbi:phage tail protein, partial [Stenotrophomonas maltophilia]|uniref:phage tail-collar fiber domain-containing protein n=1 Tax=Stenotrophomonas maltophilia TaxID=40324 RepID=UPI0034E20327
SNYPATYKPNPADGTARIMTFRMILQIDNTANFDLVIDPDVVLATIQKVEDAKLEIYQNTVNTVNTIEDLLKLKVWDGRTVYVQSNVLNDNEDGYFVYDSSKKNINDGGLILNGWIRKGIKKIYLKFFNMLLDGETDETLKLQKLINAAENYNLVNNLRLSIDGL